MSVVGKREKDVNLFLSINFLLVSVLNVTVSYGVLVRLLQEWYFFLHFMDEMMAVSLSCLLKCFTTDL